MEKMMMAGYTIGVDAYGDIKNICPLYGEKVAVIGGIRALTAAQNAILRAIEEAGMESIGVFHCGEGDSRESIAQLTSEIEDADMIFAVGGGRVIDLCKVLAHETELPMFAFPTIASTCASCTGLGILYHESGMKEEYSFSEVPPNHIFINTQIIADAPSMYLGAGMAGALAKHYERVLFSHGNTVGYSGAMGLALSPMCAEPVLRWGIKAMLDCMAHQVTNELTEVILACIVSTGYVSNFIQTRDHIGVSHALYHGFRQIAAVSQSNDFHGRIALFGVLILLTIDQQYEERDRLYAFCKSIGIPVSLGDFHITSEECFRVIRSVIDKIQTPYVVTDDMVMGGILELEEYHQNESEFSEEDEEEYLI